MLDFRQSLLVMTRIDHGWCWQQPDPAPAWFLALVLLGAVYAAALYLRLLAFAALYLRRPKELRRRYGAWTVVTGPTSGIGRSMAMELAHRGLDLVLLGRDASKLSEISDEIKSQHGVKTRTVVFDPSLVGTAQRDKAMRRLRDAVDGLDVGVLVNNAGVARPFARYLHDPDVEAWAKMIRVNLWALTELTSAVLPGMVARGRGAIVNIGSASSEALPSYPLYTTYASPLPSYPLYTTYASTKRHVAQFSRSLYVEYKSKGVDIQCQVPFFVATNMVHPGALPRVVTPMVTTTNTYARAAVRWIGHAPLCTPGATHQLLWCFTTTVVPDTVLNWSLLYVVQRQRRAGDVYRALTGVKLKV